MLVTVNHQPVELPERATIPTLFSSLQMESTSGIALAINEQIIRRDQWENHYFCENDQVLIIKATQGG